MYSDIQQDLENCKMWISFYQTVLSNYDLFNNIISKKLLIEQLNYYRNMLIFLRKDLKKYEIRN